MIDQIAMSMTEVDLSVITTEKTTAYIYILMDADRVIYVGRTGSLFQRLAAHWYGSTQHNPKPFTRAFFVEVSIPDAPAYEGALVRRFNPPLVDKVYSNETRDAEVLSALGLEIDRANRDAFVSRFKQSYVDMASRRRVREFARCRSPWRRGRSLSRAIWNSTLRYLKRVEKTKAAS